MMNQKSVFHEYVLDRTGNKNKNFIMLVLGETGSGKSYACLRLAETLDLTYLIDRCVFKPAEFVQLINDLVEKSERGEKISSLVIVWEETGTTISARKFMSLINNVINYVFQVCRHLNLIIIINVPNAKFIDSNTRKLCHCIGTMSGINQERKTSKMKIQMMQTNVITGKQYFKHLRFDKSGKRSKLKNIILGMPSSELVTEYEKKKWEYNKFLYRDVLKQLSDNEPKKPETKYDKFKKAYDIMGDDNIKLMQLCDLDRNTLDNYKYRYKSEKKAFLPLQA